MSKIDVKFAGESIGPGAIHDLRLPVSQTFAGDDISLPLRVVRAKEPGPVVLVTAALHGDEINGTGVVHDLMFARRPELTRGTLVLVPVVDIFGFETQSRYMPDRRDLNRCFPGNANGSLSSRFADTVFQELVRKADYVLDLHSAATGRTNFPNVRADLDNDDCRRLAEAFGCELIVDGKGPESSMRRSAVEAGVPTVILEAGDPSKIEPSVLEIGVRGVMNVLSKLEMVDDQPKVPPYQTTVRRTQWLRGSVGGLLRFHISPGSIVDKDQPIATNYSVFGEQQNAIVSPFDAVVLGMVTLPTVRPGEPICHLAVPDLDIDDIREALGEAKRRDPANQVRRDLATSMVVEDAPD
ncbi:MAG: succinylglutamate desuccinylase/aspartoacylase family protein [Planctomycetota bacterium]